MRIHGASIKPQVWIDREQRTIAMRLGARYSMEIDEAIELARALVAAVDAVKDEGVRGK